MISIKSLIYEAFLTAGILNPNDEFDGYYPTKGLELLNEMLADWSKLGIYIPYTSKLAINVTENVYQYPVSPPIAEFLQGNIVSSTNVKTNLVLINEKQHNTFNYTNATGIPYRIYIDDDFDLVDLNTGEGSSLISLYPAPNANYTMNLVVKQYFLKVELSDDVYNFPRYYNKVLRYQLAKDIADYWQEPLSPEFMDSYNKLIKGLKAAVPKDLSINTINPFLTFRNYRPWWR